MKAGPIRAGEHQIRVPIAQANRQPLLGLASAVGTQRRHRRRVGGKQAATLGRLRLRYLHPVVHDNPRAATATRPASRSRRPTTAHSGRTWSAARVSSRPTGNGPWLDLAGSRDRPSAPDLRRQPLHPRLADHPGGRGSRPGRQQARRVIALDAADTAIGSAADEDSSRRPRAAFFSPARLVGERSVALARLHRPQATQQVLEQLTFAG
jgi:hypothetical protein